MIYFDIDGVARHLNMAVYGYDPNQWAKKNDKGLTLLNMVDADPSICARAPPTEYLPFINSLPGVVFLSNQAPSWQKFTDAWLHKHIKISFRVHYVVDKLACIQPTDYIMDDYPFFKSYDQILLVDRPYN